MDLAAPGVNVFSTLPNHPFENGTIKRAFQGPRVGSVDVPPVALALSTPYGTSNSSVRNCLQAAAGGIPGTAPTSPPAGSRPQGRSPRKDGRDAVEAPEKEPRPPLAPARSPTEASITRIQIPLEASPNSSPGRGTVLSGAEGNFITSMHIRRGRRRSSRGPAPKGSPKQKPAATAPWRCNEVDAVRSSGGAQSMLAR